MAVQIKVWIENPVVNIRGWRHGKKSRSGQLEAI